jgi:DtxR family Mn-dependent transcriptional regulator
MQTLSRAAQDYLKAIYRLSQRRGRATTTQLAQWLNVTPATVTSMLQKMARLDPPLVAYQKHQGATLTADGERAALTVVRRHRLLELFLHEKLGYTWDEVHEEAEQLEHAVSPALAQRMADLLGNPCHDPHGHPIPDEELQLAPSTAVPLLTLQPGVTAVIHRVRDEDAGLLRELAELGIRPLVQITIVAQTDQTLTIQVAGQTETITITPQAARQIFVDALPEVC